MVYQAAIPIATAVGEFAAPYLLRKAGEIGLTRFIQVYGSAAATAIGIQKTQPVDLQTEKILGMPVSHITGQGEVYDDIDYSYIDEDKENDEVPTKTTEEKLTEPTEPEPPEDPDVVGDAIATEVAIHTTKRLLEDKELSVSQQTKNLTSKIKNKITTWEDHFPTIEEATKAAKDVGGTLKEFEEGLIEKKITFKKIGYDIGQHFGIYYDGKEVGSLVPLEQTYEGIKEYNLHFPWEIDAVDTFTGLQNAKNISKEILTKGLLDKSPPIKDPFYWEPLRKTFQEATFDKKGNYVEFSEPAHTEKELEELVERVNKNK